MIMITIINKLLISSPVMLLTISLIFFFSLNNILELRCLTFAASEGVPVKVGLVLDNERFQGEMQLSCIKMALSDFYVAHPDFRTRIDLHVKESRNHNVVNVAAAALYLLKYSEVKAIILSSTTSVAAEFVIQLGEKTQVPIVSYSTTIPSLKSSYFIHAAAHNDSLQVKVISALMQAFQWREVIPIYEDNDYGSGLIPYLDDALQHIGARIPSHDMALSLSASNVQISELLQKLKVRQTRVFLVHMSPELASRLFLQVNELEMMDKGYAWIVTTSISNELSSLNQSVIEAMQGVIGLETYYPKTNELKQFESRWERKFKDVKLNVMGLWAYDVAFALAQSVEKAVVPNSAIARTKMAGNLTDLDTVGVSSIGPELLKALHNTSFRGLAGNFSLTDGKLISSSSTFKVVNVFNSGGRDIGFWTTENGLTRKLDMNGSNTHIPPTSEDLGPVIWPGETSSSPTGWKIPVDGRRLRVLVPVRQVYEELVNVSSLKSSGTTEFTCNVTGFSIDIFEAVMEKLGYSYDYYAFTCSNDRKPAGTYNDLIHQVFLRNYDIAVGDISIIGKRTSEVEFTHPYTEFGVTMVVLLKNDRPSAWVFLQPLSKDLWLTILTTFVFIAVVIWVFEHRINDEFRGPPLHQVGTSLFYSFSMMVFAHKETVLNNLSRVVVIVWAFVVLVLTQSYTASLSSLLTVRQLQSTTVDELIRTGARVGVQNGTYVRSLLIQVGFPEQAIVWYQTTEQLDYLLSNGGIAAVFDEAPYMKLFLAKYPSKYIMHPPVYRTDGFGFALPKGSPLVPEISREILCMEGYNMPIIEKKWGMQIYNASDQGHDASQSSLISIDNVWGLFLVVAVTSISSLIIHFAQFLYQRRDIWIYSDASVWFKVQGLGKAFMQRDMAVREFRNREVAVQSIRNYKTDEACSDDGDNAAFEAQITTTRSMAPSRQGDSTAAYAPLETDQVALSSGVHKTIRTYWSM